MSFFTDYSRNAYRLSDREVEILSYVASLVEKGLPFPQKPSELVWKLEMKWAPEMIFSEDCTFGMWTYVHRNSVFIRPEDNRFTARRIEKKAKKLSLEEEAKVYTMLSAPAYSEVMFKHLRDVDHALLSFAVNLLENDGHTACVVMHEMWHRQQFVSHPVKYILSAILTNLVSYEWACGQSWSIEHDVRVKVDNDVLKGRLRAIYQKFYEYIYNLNRFLRPGGDARDKEEAKKTVMELEKDEEVQMLTRLVGK